jgi:hypothetical protein
LFHLISTLLPALIFDQVDNQSAERPDDGMAGGKDEIVFEAVRA